MNFNIFLLLDAGVGESIRNDPKSTKLGFQIMLHIDIPVTGTAYRPEVITVIDIFMNLGNFQLATITNCGGCSVIRNFQTPVIKSAYYSQS